VEEGMLSERVKREKEELLSAQPQIDTERLELLLDTYREGSMKPPIMHRAELFNRLCSEKTIYIDRNPIVGTLTKYKYGAYPVVEEGCAWMKRTDEFFLPRGKAQIIPQAREWIDKAVELWWDSNLFSLTREVVLKTHGIDIRAFSKCGVWIEATPGSASHILVPDYSKVLNNGLKVIVAEIEQEEAKLNTGDPGALDKWYFYQAAKLTLNGMAVLAQRYASLAREMAEEEKNVVRKQELEEIAHICDWVPVNPARNFREAVQAFWFIMLGVWLEAPKALTAPPATLTRSLYPFYKKDKGEGRITDQEVIELLQLLFLKFNQLAHVLPPHGYRINQSRLGLQLNIGGLTSAGDDATNDLDWLILEAQQRIMLPEPLVSLVYHDRLSEEFLLKCVDLIRTGIGQPAFHNSQVAIERHLYHHRMPLEEARPLAVAGCVQSFIPGYMDGYFETRLNVAKMIELALENGNDPLTGIQLGLETGEAESFQTYDQFYQAFLKQLKYFVPLTHDVSRTAWSLQRNFPTPFGSTLVNDCIEKGKDVSDGGARYSFGDGVCLVGVVDAANSLAAIKKLVFEEKKLTMSQLREALAADFEGYEDVEQMCIAAPKYGNDDEYADSIAKDIYEICCDLHPKTDHLGRPVMPSAYSITTHSAFGEFTGALPNGKKARKPLVDASVSAQGGTDKNGPTALVKSAAKIIDTVKYGSSHFNMKFHPTAVKGIDGARKLLSLIKTYFDLGGYHVQFNCVSGETLRDAQLHPENHKWLIVRVAGFSAYFVTLDKDVQDDIISRTEFSRW
jgi:pyruvate formate-lyase/glycerol dehydratase family glycyl radical enzyme